MTGDPHDEAANRRRHTRRRSFKGGRIIYNNARSTVGCTIKDLSDGGGRLALSGFIELPGRFDLEIAGGATLPCKVAWRRGLQIGVEFLKR